MGAGLTKGLLSQHGFVPENHTDFIITAIGGGCLGILLLFALLLALLWRLQPVWGLVGGWNLHHAGFQVLVNLGMATGMVPAVVIADELRGSVDGGQGSPQRNQKGWFYDAPTPLGLGRLMTP